MSDTSPRPALQWYWACREGSTGHSSSLGGVPEARDVAEDVGLSADIAAGGISALPNSSSSGSSCSGSSVRGGCTREETKVAELVLEQLDEQWFHDNVVKWPSSRLGSPPGVIDKDMGSPFRCREIAPVVLSTTQGDVASGTVKPRLRVGERALNPSRSRLEIRRLSDGEQHLKGCVERDPTRRQTLGGEVNPRRFADISNAQLSSVSQTLTKSDTVHQFRYPSEENPLQDFLPLPQLPSGPLMGVTEDEEMENDLFEKILANRPSKLSTINPGRLSRGPLQENSSNNSDQLPIKHAPKAVRRRRLKGTKSLTDLEYEELRGLKDLGFEVSKDDLTPPVVRMFPGLQRQGIPPYNSPQSQSQASVQNTHPNQNVLSQSRFTPVQHLLWPRRPDSPLINTPFLDPSIDMKGQLKTWASEMASIVSTEC
ncbi:uncharacterized protein [Physcomitrium patens]|uniref:Uncharacterized protein n=1 Tax=Physcomitrium patens TaxID=3218 RepID=A0A2K1JUM5_PHYPA|nr:uncharacterized protein LOC112288759 [Physcomitrium patens]PNR45216.1 hypothetical protein PHYPA_014987 [Physcomitrium patens]|eukprot:XP_024389059.1 uncharacterized protein LOC112288759 [Physcomitrella patens]